MNRNETTKKPCPDCGRDRCPCCGAPEIESLGPRTHYYCGSSDADTRAFAQTHQCKDNVRRLMNCREEGIVK
jgi:hypothetical protein